MVDSGHMQTVELHRFMHKLLATSIKQVALVWHENGDTATRNWLLHQAQQVTEVQALRTGKARDVDGLMVHSNQETGRVRHYKITDSSYKQIDSL